jgi:hypothetical protein
VDVQLDNFSLNSANGEMLSAVWWGWLGRSRNASWRGYTWANLATGSRNPAGLGHNIKDALS